MSTRRSIRIAAVAAATAGLLSPMLARASTAPAADWPTLGGNGARTFYNAGESAVTAANVATMVPKWRFPTVGSVSASPAVATVGGTRMVFDGDYTGMFYALNADTGLPLWSKCLIDNAPAPAPVCSPPYPTNPTNQVDYGAIVASPAVASVGPTPVVFEAATSAVWALDAATGAKRWSFDTGGSPTLPDGSANPRYGANYTPNYEVESSPLVVTHPVTHEQLVVFSVDCNAYCAKPGGVYAVDAADGHLVWFFDLVTSSAYSPPATSPPVHALAPWDVGPTTAGTGKCGGVWASEAVDLTLNPPLVFTATADCPQPAPRASAYYESVFALNLGTGAGVWTSLQSNADAADMDYGATPNVFTLASGQHVVGEASKQGTYSLFDAATGVQKWSTRVALGGNFGGLYNGATDGQNVYVTSALGTASGSGFTAGDDALRGREFAIDAETGIVKWSQQVGTPTLGQNMVIPGVYFTSSLDHFVHAYDTVNGAPLAALPAGGAVSSTPVVIGGELFVGSGTGATWRSAVGTGLNPIGFPTDYPAPTPIPIGEFAQGISAFCLPTSLGCVSHGVVPAGG